MSHHGPVVIFDILVFLAVFLIVCTLLPAIFSRKVQRSIGWYSLMVAWLVYSVNFGLLIGQQGRPKDLPRRLCLVQTLLIYSASALATSSTLCYYLEFYFKIAGLKSGNLRPQSTVRTFWLTTTPWFICLAMFVQMLVFILVQDDPPGVALVSGGFYCWVESSLQNILMATITTCMMGILVPLEVWTGFSMYRHWASFKRLGQTDRRLFLTVYVKFLFITISASFTFGRVINALASDADLLGTTGAISLLIIPIFVALAFGTQKDILQAWAFWRPSKPYNTIIFHHRTLATIGITSPSNDGILQLHPQEERQQSPCPPEPTEMPAGTNAITGPEREVAKGHIC